MSKLITPLMKAMVFGLYHGQKIMRHQDYQKANYASPEYASPKSYLEVKSILTISNADAHEVNATRFFYEKRKVRDVRYSPEIKHIDFLRSRGYALPAFGFSVEELVDAGVFKLKEE